MRAGMLVAAGKLIVVGPIFNPIGLTRLRIPGGRGVLGPGMMSLGKGLRA